MILKTSKRIFLTSSTLCPFGDLLSLRRHPLGDISLQMVTVRTAYDNDHPHAFNIITLLKQHIFAAPNEEEMMKWISAISLTQQNDQSGKVGGFTFRMSKKT